MAATVDSGIALPTIREMIECLQHPGPLSEHPVMQRIRVRNEAELTAQRPKLTLIRGGDDA